MLNEQNYRGAGTESYFSEAMYVCAPMYQISSYKFNPNRF